MTLADRLIYVLVGVALTIFAVGWWAEYRVRLAERQAYAQLEDRALTHINILDEAIKLGVTSPVERGLAYSEAVGRHLRRAQRDPAATDAPTPARGATKR